MHFTQQLKQKHLPFLSVMSHTLYTATQTAPQNMTPTDQPLAPQIRHPRFPGSENWGSRCHLYPADEHNQINGNLSLISLPAS
jgi:hypothetical protein